MEWSLNIKTEPPAEPVSLDDAKEHCKVDGNAHNVTLTRLIETARRHVELTITRRSLITQTLEYRLDAFPDEIELKRPPVVSVTSIKYIDTNGDLQTLSADDYEVDIYSWPARIRPAYSSSWPSIRETMNAVTIEYITGYGDTGESVPTDIIQAILILIAHWFENPELIAPLIKVVPMSVTNLLVDYRDGGPG